MAGEVRAPAATRRVPKSAYGLADQVVSSLTNFIGVIAASRVLEPVDLGIFGVTSAVMMTAIGLNRAGVAEPLSVEVAPLAAGERTSIVKSATASTVVGAALLALALIGASLLAPQTFGSAGYVAAGFIPFLLVHDTWRYACTSAGKTAVVLVSDTVWLLCVVVGALIFRVSDGSQAMLLWLGGLLPALLVLAIHPSTGMARPSIEFVRRHRVYVAPIVLAFALVVFAGNLLPFVIGVLGEIELAGEYRLLQAVFGPVGVLVQASSLLGLPLLARRRSLGARALVNGIAGIGALLAVAAICWALILILIPLDVGVDAFGTSWPAVRSALPFMLVFFLVQTVGFGALLLLKSINNGKAVLTARVIVGPGLLAGAVGGLWLGSSIDSILIGMCVAGGVAALVWVVVSRRALSTWEPPTGEWPPPTASWTTVPWPPPSPMG